MPEVPRKHSNRWHELVQMIAVDLPIT